MPSPQRYLKKDPNSKGRGAGVYYRRTSGRFGAKKNDPYYSKYSEERDKKIKARGYKTSKVGLPRKSKIKHAGDGILER